MARGRGQGNNAPADVSSRAHAEEINSKLSWLINNDHAAAKLRDEFHGQQLYVVGGAVRDVYSGRDPKDIDMMICGIAEKDLVEKLDSLPGRVDYTGKSFGVYRYRYRGDEVELAMPRQEVSTGDGYRDFEITANHELDVEADLLRRDYTVNAMAWDITNSKIIDPFGGRADATSRRLRPVREQALQEDPLRILRGVVLVARYDLTADDEVKQQLQNNRHLLRELANERIGDEIRKLLRAPHPNKGIRLINDLQLFDAFNDFPRLDAIDQSLPESLRMAATIRNISRADIPLISRALLLTNDEIKTIQGVLISRDEAPDNNVSDQEIRRYMSRHSREHTLNWAMVSSNSALEKRLKEQAGNPLTISELAVSGQDLLDAGFKPGPDFGKALSNLLQLVVDEPSRNTHDELLPIALSQFNS
jgi:tRNA nucleotidyltransferase (CCA-adding enzyme)